MRICLVRLPSSFLINERAFPPLGLMAVGTGLKLRGHDVTIFDGDIKDVPMDFKNYGMGPTTPEYSYALDLKEKIKAKNPRARVIVGGPFASLNAKRCIDDDFDCVVMGDGEVISDTAFKCEYRLLAGEELPLDEYPIIDRTLLDIKKYEYFLGGRLATTIVTSRGCPYACAFCCKNQQSIRQRSVAKIIEEIDILHFDLGYGALAFPEDNFILNKSRAEEICQRLWELNINWRCLARADLVVKHGQSFAKLMAKSGCKEVGMGIESGSDRILSGINKGETISTIKQGIKMLRREGIRIKGFFILGLPGESLETLKETDSFLREMRLDDMDIKIYQPYPATPIWDNRENYDIQWWDMDFNDMFYKGRRGDYHGNVRTSSLTNQQIVKAMDEMEIAYKYAS